MSGALTSDWALQGVMITLALVYATIKAWRRNDRRDLRFSTALLQAITFQAALVLLVSIFYPPLFQNLKNQQSFITIVAMMTLIYSSRDIVSDFTRSHTDRAKSGGGN